MLQCLLTFKFYIIIRKTIIMNKKRVVMKTLVNNDKKKCSRDTS